MKKQPDTNTHKTLFLMIAFIVAGFTYIKGQSVTRIKTEGNSIVIQDSRSHFKTSSGFFNEFEVEYRGKIEITDDDRDIKSISSGGYFELSKTTFGNRRRIVIREENGRLNRRYFEGRNELEYEPEGRRWLGDVLLDVLRSTGIAAESRVKRIHGKGGVNGVLNEIEQLRGDYVKSIYASELLGINGLKPAEYETIVDRISREINSDHYLSRILIENTDKFLENEGSSIAFFRGIRELSSDHYASSVLREAIQNRELSEKALKEVMNAVQYINSDHYMTTVLKEVMDREKLTSEIVTELIAATNDISSDHYKTVVLKDALREELSREAFLSLMKSVTDMSSDHYITEVLKELIKKNDDKLTDDFVNDIIRFTGEMSSDHYIHVILKELVQDYDLSDQAFETLVQSIDEMSSDHYATEVLESALDKDDLSENAIISIIKATSDISSDHYLSKILIEVGKKIKPEYNRARSEFMKAVKNIRSDTYYGRVMRSIDN